MRRLIFIFIGFILICVILTLLGDMLRDYLDHIGN